MMDFTIRRFRPDTDSFKLFDCGNADLNGFLLETDSAEPNASISQKELLAVTYVVEDNATNVILAYFSLLHDKIERRLVDSPAWNKLSRSIVNAKRRSSYPALKIGKLAVGKDIKSKGLGTTILHFIEGLYLEDRRAGCRFITVDALREAEIFYQKQHFRRLKDPAPDDETVLMYFDLKAIV